MALLERITGQQAMPLEVHPDVDSLPTEIMGLPVPGADAKRFVNGAQDAFAASGFLLFHTMHYAGGSSLGDDVVALAPYRDPYRVMQRVGINGDNFGITTEAIVEWFHAIEREQAVRFRSIGFDFVAATWNGPFADTHRLGQRYLALCPEAGLSARRVGRDLARAQFLYCW